MNSDLLQAIRERLAADDEPGAGAIGWRFYLHDSVPSTNDEALVKVRRGEPEGVTVVANFQTAGRGRQGRHWWSEPGAGLLFSVIFRPVSESGADFVMLAALAVCDALTRRQFEARSKWPNDILVRDHKIAGILVEEARDGQDTGGIVVGIGLNVNATSLPSDIAETATSLRMETGRLHERSEILWNILGALESRVVDLRGGGRDRLRSQWAAGCGTLGRRVCVRASGETIEGYAEDIDAAGALVVRLDNGIRRAVQTGDVEEVRT